MVLRIEIPAMVKVSFWFPVKLRTGVHFEELPEYLSQGVTDTWPGACYAQLAQSWPHFTATRRIGPGGSQNAAPLFEFVISMVSGTILGNTHLSRVHTCLHRQFSWGSGSRRLFANIVGARVGKAGMIHHRTAPGLKSFMLHSG